MNISLTHDHLLLLVTACEQCLGTHFEQGGVETWRGLLQKTGLREQDDLTDREFRPAVLGVRLGLGKRTGVSLARDLQRHDLVRRWCDQWWKVTIDGAEAAAAFKKSLSTAKGNAAVRTHEPHRPCESWSCPCCKALHAAPKARYCGRCGGRRPSLTPDQNVARIDVRLLVLLTTAFASGAVVGVILCR